MLVNRVKLVREECRACEVEHEVGSSGHGQRRLRFEERSVTSDDALLSFKGPPRILTQAFGRVCFGQGRSVADDLYR